MAAKGDFCRLDVVPSILLGHPRGGDALRAFLRQNLSCSIAKNRAQ
jgi:hypothetical protein